MEQNVKPKKIRGKGPGPRPECWKVKDPLGHEQHIAWHRMRAQAHYRKEEWTLTFEEYQQLWADHWAEKGRKSDQYSLTRIDPEGPWSKNNTICTKRIHYLRRQRAIKAGNSYDITKQD